MDNDDSIAQSDRRNTDRLPLQGEVSVEFGDAPLVGPGQNVSEQGVFFIAETSLRVRVRVGDAEEWRDGEVIRVHAMGENTLGVAIRFR